MSEASSGKEFIVTMALNRPDLVVLHVDWLGRIQTFLRRAARSPDEGRPTARQSALPPAVMQFRGWRLDTAARGLWNPAGTWVRLTGGEFALLSELARHPCQALSRERLAARLCERPEGTRAIDALIARLRKKLEANPRQPSFILSVRRIGYMLIDR